MFDLNMTATPLEGEVKPQDSGTEKKPLQTQADSGTSPAPKPGASSSRNNSFVPPHLAHLLMMAKDLPNDPSSPPHVLLLNSNHARLPPHTSAFSEPPATAWLGGTSAEPTHLAVVAPAPGDGAPAEREVLVWPLRKRGRVVVVWPRNGAGGGLPAGNQNEASSCQTSIDLDSQVSSDGESDSCKLRNSLDKTTSQAPVVDLDSLPDEIPVEPQYPVRQEEAPFHPTLFPGSSDDLPMSPEDEFRLREMAFHAGFQFETERCTHEARCRSCLDFCQYLLPSLQEGFGPGGGGSESDDESESVLIDVEDDEALQGWKMSKRGPRSKSSGYRGVTYYKRTGRWEAHIWHEGSQAYLGSCVTKEEAARTFDQAALLLCGSAVETNFKPESYKMEMAYLYKLSKVQLQMYLRRDTRGFGAQVSYPGVKRVKGFYQADYGSMLLGLFATEEDAARALYSEVVRESSGANANLILDAHHVRNMPSYAAQRFAALYPEAVKEMQLRNKGIANPLERPRVPLRTLSPQKKMPSTRQARTPNQDATSPPAAARAMAAPPHRAATDQLPGNEINVDIEVSPGLLTRDRSWGATRKRRLHAAGMNLMAAHYRQSCPHQPSNGTNTPTRQQLRYMLPRFVRVRAATTRAPSSPSLPSIPRTTIEASISAFIKFKLFSVDISVAVESGLGGDRTRAHGESEPELRDQFNSRPKQRCKFTGAAAPGNPHAKHLCKKCLLALGKRR